MSTGGSAMNPAETGMLIRVPAAELPLPAQSLLDSDVPRRPDSRFLPRRTTLTWLPAAWAAALTVVGLTSLYAMLSAGSDPANRDQRFAFGAIAGICLVAAAMAVRRVIPGLRERRAIDDGRYRRGLHVLGLEGLLIADGHTHTWVPRLLLPEPMSVSSRGGGASVMSYSYILVDARGRTERLDCGTQTQTALWAWARLGQLPRGDGWR